MKKIFYITHICLSITIVNAQEQHYNLLIGTYTTNCESQGIYVYDFNAITAETQFKATTNRVINPSYLTISKDSEFVYSVNENGEDSTVSAFGFNTSSGQLDFLNKQDSKGADPCHIINDDKNVIIANYSGGTATVFKKLAGGTLSPAQQVIQHTGGSIDKSRQESAHIHMAHFTPDYKNVIINDLGKDKVYLYTYHADSNNEILVPKDSIAVRPGSGPRHITFSPNGKYAYLLHEMDGSLTVFAYNNKLSKIQETTIIAKKFKGDIAAADIHVSPDGTFLYATNRGTANNITIFKINKNGKLIFKDETSTLGKGPRNFVIDPSGSYLLVAQQYSNNVVVFRIHKKTGKLSDTGKRIELCSPVCLVFNTVKL